jgi:hypothetical protein
VLDEEVPEVQDEAPGVLAPVLALEAEPHAACAVPLSTRWLPRELGFVTTSPSNSAEDIQISSYFT